MQLREVKQFLLSRKMFLVLQSRQRYFFTFYISFYFSHFFKFITWFLESSTCVHTHTHKHVSVYLVYLHWSLSVSSGHRQRAENKWLTLRMSNVIVCSLCHSLSPHLAASLKLIYYMYILRKGFISLTYLLSAAPQIAEANE